MIDQAESPKNFVGKLCAITSEISSTYINDSNDAIVDSNLDLDNANSNDINSNSESSIKGNTSINTLIYYCYYYYY